MRNFIIAATLAFVGTQANSATLGFNNLIDAWIDSDEPFRSSATITEAGYTIRGTADTGCNLDGRFYTTGTLELQDRQGCMSAFGGATISASGRVFSIFSLEITGGFPNAIRYDLFEPSIEDPTVDYEPYFESGLIGGDRFTGNKDGFRLGARVVGYHAIKADGSIVSDSLITPFGEPAQTHALVAPEAFHDIVGLSLYYRRTFDALEVMCEPTNIESGLFSLHLKDALVEACSSGQSSLQLSNGFFFNIRMDDYRTGAVNLDNFKVSPVPLPSSAVLMIGAIAGLAGLGRRGNKSATNRP